MCSSRSKSASTSRFRRQDRSRSRNTATVGAALRSTTCRRTCRFPSDHDARCCMQSRSVDGQDGKPGAMCGAALAFQRPQPAQSVPSRFRPRRNDSASQAAPRHRFTSVICGAMSSHPPHPTDPVRKTTLHRPAPGRCTKYHEKRCRGRSCSVVSDCGFCLTQNRSLSRRTAPNQPGRMIFAADGAVTGIGRVAWASAS